MTRGYVFTLDGTVQNLWTLISASISDPTFSNSAFVPSTVCNLKIYFPISGPNSANNAGFNCSVINGTVEVKNLISDSTYEINSDRNNINVKRFSLQGSVANVQVEVTLTSN